METQNVIHFKPLERLSAGCLLVFENGFLRWTQGFKIGPDQVLRNANFRSANNKEISREAAPFRLAQESFRKR